MISEGDSTQRDVQTAILIQESEERHNEEMLASDLERIYGWNSNHAREIAELAWIEMYAEKEGE